MPNFPVLCTPKNQIMIGTASPESVGNLIISNAASSVSNNGYPTGNMAIFIPVEIYEPITFAKMTLLRGTGISGNVDIGIYDSNGRLKVSSGSVAQAASTIQTFDITDTTLNPGLYYMALAIDNTTANVVGYSVPAIDAMPFGIFQAFAVFPLPSTVVFTPVTGTLIPLISMTPKTVI